MQQVQRLPGHPRQRQVHALGLEDLLHLVEGGQAADVEVGHGFGVEQHRIRPLAAVHHGKHPLLEVVGVEEQQGGVEAVDHQSGGLRVLGQLDLAVDAVHPAEHRVARAIGVVEQAQYGDADGDEDSRQHADAEHADGGQQAEAELEAAELPEALQRLHVDQAPAGQQQDRTERRHRHPAQGLVQQQQGGGDHQRGDHADQLGLAADHVVHRGA